MPRLEVLPRAVVFDMDGTLLDSERLARACFQQACEDIGFTPDMAVYDRCVGSTWEETERIMCSSFGAGFSYAQMDARWGELYQAHITTQPVDKKPGVVDLLSELQALRIPMAVATSSRRATVETKLMMAQIDGYFEFLVCGGETPRGKPHADPYLAAAMNLDCSPGHCWAIEDSDNGVRSATAAGLTVFQIPDELAPAAEIVSLGHEVLHSVADLVPRLR